MFRKLLSKIRKSKSESDLHEDSITVATFSHSLNDKVLRISSETFLIIRNEKFQDLNFLDRSIVVLND